MENKKELTWKEFFEKKDLSFKEDFRFLIHFFLFSGRFWLGAILGAISFHLTKQLGLGF